MNCDVKRIQFRRTQRSDLQTQFWLRFFAFIIDILVIQLVGPPIILLASNIFSFEFIQLNDYSDELVLEAFRNNMQILLVTYVSIFIVYGSVMESKFRGTIGKRFVGFVVTDESLNSISFSKALIRNLFKVLAIVSVVGVTIIDMIPTRQGVHDLLIKTYLNRR